MTISTRGANDPTDSSTRVVSPEEVEERMDDLSTDVEPDFPHEKLAELDTKISSPRWVVPVLPDQELECLLLASIDLCKKGEYIYLYFILLIVK